MAGQIVGRHRTIFDDAGFRRQINPHGSALAGLAGNGHGGGVAVSSQPGKGTSVRGYLPAEPSIVEDGAVAADDLAGHETVLIVDDEDSILNMSQKILSSYGYRVLTANSGQKALDILSGNDGPVELVVTDLVMPAMTGRELSEQIRRLWPATRILST